MKISPPKPKYRTPSLGNIAGLLVVASLLGQVLGFLRTKLVNGNFPATGPHSTDAYFAAFNIPDFFFFTLAAGALGVAFMPVLADRLIKGDKKGMWELSASLMNLLAIVMAVVGVIILVFAQPLIKYIVAPHLGPQQLHNAVVIMRWLAFNPLLFTLSGVLTATQQTLGRFFFYAIAPLFYNLSIIISIYVFKGNIGLVGLGVGAFIGAVLQLVIVALGMIKMKYRWYPKILWRSADFRTILRQLPPRSLDQGVDQVQSIVETRFASRLGGGYVTYYNNAYVLHTAPILLLGTAISTAAFPRMAFRLSQGRPDLFRREFLRILRALVWLTVPVVVVCFFARGYLARLIFSRDAPEIALVFGFLTVAIFFRTIYALVSRWFYAQKDTKTPLYVSVFVIALNVILAYFLSRPDSYGVAGLALAQSIVAAVEVVTLLAVMVYRDRKLLDGYFWRGLLKIMSVGGFSIIASYTMVSIFPLAIRDRGIVTLGSKLLLITAVTFAVHIAVSALFGIEEVWPLLTRARRLVLRPIRVNYRF